MSPRGRLTVPALPALPLLGNTLELRYQRLALLERISRQFGDIGAFHFGSRRVPVLNTPELVRQILVDQENSFEKTATVRALGTPILGNGIFLSEGEEHHRQRKLLAPLFQHRHILDYAEIMTSCTVRLAEEWLDGHVIDLAKEMTRLTLWIISKILFDADVLEEEQELGEALTSIFRHFASEVTNPLRLPLAWPTPRNQCVRRALAQVNATIYRLIEERRQNGEQHKDFLSTLLQAQNNEFGNTLTNQQMRDEALSLFIAGHETSANALTWCWYLLASHPDIYTKVREEGDRVLAGRLPTTADLPNLPYTLQTFKEALRLYPPVYAFTRRTTSSIQLAGYNIPAGASVVISPYILHRRSLLFPEPDRFNPDRFASQLEKRLPRYAYLPFGAGSHICLGMHLALLEGHLLLATLIQNLTFELVESGPIEPEPLLTLRPKGPVLMRVQKRDRSA